MINHSIENIYCYAGPNLDLLELGLEAPLVRSAAALTLSDKALQLAEVGCSLDHPHALVCSGSLAVSDYKGLAST